MNCGPWNFIPNNFHNGNDANGSIDFDYQIQFTINEITYTSITKKLTWIDFLTTIHKKEVDFANAMFTKKVNTKGVQAFMIMLDNFDDYIDKSV